MKRKGPTPAPTKTVEHNGISFAVPLGYASIQDFVSTVRFNYKNRIVLGMKPYLCKEYEQLIAQFEKAGL
jgi:hypothetical protein